MHMKAKWCLKKTPLRTPDGSNFDLSTSSTGNRTVPSIFTGLKSLADRSSISSHWNSCALFVHAYACYAPIKNHFICKKFFVGITFYGFGKLTLELYMALLLFPYTLISLYSTFPILWFPYTLISLL